jgi:hypothetical protein
MAPTGDPPVDIPIAIPNKIGITVPTTNESPIPATGPIKPARRPLMVSSSTTSLPLARAYSRLAVIPTIKEPSCGSVLKKARYVSKALARSSFFFGQSVWPKKLGMLFRKQIEKKESICVYLSPCLCPKA